MELWKIISKVSMAFTLKLAFTHFFWLTRGSIPVLPLIFIAELKIPLVKTFFCLSRQKVDMRGHWFSSRPMTYSTSIFMQFSGGKITKSQGVMVVNCATKSEKIYYAFGKLALYLSQNLISSLNRDIYL